MRALTVQQLIDRLGELPRDAEVIVDLGTGAKQILRAPSAVSLHGLDLTKGGGVRVFSVSDPDGLGHVALEA